MRCPGQHSSPMFEILRHCSLKRREATSNPLYNGKSRRSIFLEAGGKRVVFRDMGGRVQGLGTLSGSVWAVDRPHEVHLRVIERWRNGWQRSFLLRVLLRMQSPMKCRKTHSTLLPTHLEPNGMTSECRGPLLRRSGMWLDWRRMVYPKLTYIAVIGHDWRFPNAIRVSRKTKC